MKEVKEVKKESAELRAEIGSTLKFSPFPLGRKSSPATLLAVDKQKSH